MSFGLADRTGSGGGFVGTVCQYGRGKAPPRPTFQGVRKGSLFSCGDFPGRHGIVKETKMTGVQHDKKKSEKS